ncbi:putative holin-like toxin [Lactiplantibacillus plantarum]|nr:putative holin-like toxin [Lactiplantibacillus plantarum]MDF3266326.1 putative holin-like toxin [Lactiplantibacillus plantarum]MDH5112616.1 putative holin-like toxin [Lactiplantibacillus plantarum]
MLLFGTFLIALLSYIASTTNKKAALRNFGRLQGDNVFCNLDHRL